MQQDLRAIAADILAKGYLMSLATNDETGLWVSDVVYVYTSDLTIYWLSQPDTRHSKAILQHAQVAASITVSNNQGEDNLGLQLSGRAAPLDDPSSELAKLHLQKRKKEVNDESIAAISAAGQKWYGLKPERIDIICESLWGFKKYTLEF